ncbi:hypothetical protein V6N13_076046 [Hibiscus sabdariffa]
MLRRNKYVESRTKSKAAHFLFLLPEQLWLFSFVFISLLIVFSKGDETGDDNKLVKIRAMYWQRGENCNGYCC